VLARAVIGGVAVGTMTTLLFVPYLYSIFGRFERTKAQAPAQAELSHQGSPA
jgi:Cu/Ag efflux pump CusA